jgi:tripartite ATP-independent transporter DctP family solute receptor
MLCGLAPGGFSDLLARELRAADNQSLDYPTVQAMMFMDRYIRDRTNGAVSIRVFPSAQLGEEDQTIAQTRLGVIDMARVNIGPLAPLVPEADIFNLPYMFHSTDHLRKVIDGPVGEDILKRFESSGLIVLDFYDSGARSFYNSVRPIKQASDLSGLRMRVQAAPTSARMVAELGAEATRLTYSQILPALRAGLIDGAENNLPVYMTAEHHTAARFYTPTEHTMQPEILFMSRKSWLALSEPERVLLREAAKASAVFMRRRWDEWVQVTRKQAMTEGSGFVESFDRESFEAALAPMRRDILERSGLSDIAARIDSLR